MPVTQALRRKKQDSRNLILGCIVSLELAWATSVKTKQNKRQRDGLVGEGAGQAQV